MKIQNFVYENHLLFNLSPEHFQMINCINKGTNERLMKAAHKNDTSKYYAIKELAFKKTESDKILELQKEIKALEKIQNVQIKPDSLPTFYGYFQRTNEKTNEVEYSLVFDYYESSLKDLIEKKEVLSFEKIYHIYKSLINGFAFLQSHSIGHKCLKPENIMITANKIAIFGFGQVEDIEDYYQKQISNSLNEGIFYTAPEIVQALRKNKLEEKINFCKSAVYSFGLIMLELGTMKIIPKLDDENELKKVIEKSLIQFKNNYINKLIKNEDKTKFLNLLEKLDLSLSLNPIVRPDFLKIFSENLIEDPLDCRRVAIHTIIEDIPIDFLVEALGNLMKKEIIPDTDLNSKISKLEQENSMLKQKISLILEESKEMSTKNANLFNESQEKANKRYT